MEILTSGAPASNPSGHSGVFQTHPKGIQARVLLSSLFGPYAQDDEFGSRSINPMERYHNQVTRAQGSFSLRMFHRSWGIMMIQADISAPWAVLDFSTREDFARELKTNHYAVVGISSIIVNLGKVREMCRMTRAHLSLHSTIVVGGHVAAIPGIETMIDADHIVRGEGVSWMRRYLGEDENAPIRHPAIVSGMRTRIMGIGLPERKGATAATIIPVGCPMGCNFCTTSASFGDKGKFVNFFKRGDELFEVMNRMEAELEVHSFFVMDENFLLHRERAMPLRERMKEERKSCALSVFASANAMRKYTMRSWWNWACRGCGWVWNLRGPLQQAARRGNAGTHPRTAGTRNSRAGVNHHRAGAPHTRQHYGGNRARGFARDRLPPVHALYAGTGNSAVSADGRRGTPTAQCGLC